MYLVNMDEAFSQVAKEVAATSFQVTDGILYFYNEYATVACFARGTWVSVHKVEVD